MNPALAIADALVERGREKTSIRFVGSRRGLEARLVPEAGYEITLLPGRGIVRRLSLANVGAIAGLLAALVQAFVLLLKSRPSVVVSVGGYAAAPAAIAAVVLRIPLVLAESNAVPGAVNRLVARFARASAVSLPGTDLPRATVTGNPVRREIAFLDRSPEKVRSARSALGLPQDRVVLGAFGGSLGSGTINQAVSQLVERWRSRNDVAVLHIVGRRDWPDFAGRSEPPDSPLTYSAIEYENRMDLFFTAVDIVVCRAGSTTVAEVAAAGMPAVFVPLPGAPGDHQTANARTLELAGAAILVPDRDCDGARLEDVLNPLVKNLDVLQKMSVAARSFAVPDSASRVAELVESCAKGGVR